MAYQLPELPYDFNALAPVISGAIMELHYLMHHKGYVTNLNAALEKYADAEKKQDIASMIALQQAIRFNGGGHINHSIFWTILTPQNKGGGGKPTGSILQAIESSFGSFESFVEKMSMTTTAIQGSGWGWLGYCPVNKRLIIETCANQDPLSTKGLIPLLGIDVWEHAYYLDYKNVRATYVKNIWQIIHWKHVQELFEHAKMSK